MSSNLVTDYANIEQSLLFVEIKYLNGVIR